MSDTKSPMQELNTKQYYETVDVAELPPTDKDILGTSDVVTMLFEDGAMEQGYYEFNSKKWIYPEFIKTQPVSWLRPVSLSELIREVAGKAWDAGCQYQWERENFMFIKTTDKEKAVNDYINSLINTTTKDEQ